MVPQLTFLAAALYPWPALQQLVEAAVAAAQQTLLSKVGTGKQQPVMFDVTNVTNTETCVRLPLAQHRL